MNESAGVPPDDPVYDALDRLRDAIVRGSATLATALERLDAFETLLAGRNVADVMRHPDYASLPLIGDTIADAVVAVDAARRQARAEFMRRLKREGLSVKEIGALYGIRPQRVSNFLTANPPAPRRRRERAKPKRRRAGDA